MLEAGAGVAPDVVAQAGGLPSLAPIVRRNTPAVVIIAAKARIAPNSNAAPKHQRVTLRSRTGAAIEAGRQRPEALAAGSGVVFDAADGLIITNNHVVERAGELTVTFSDGRELRAILLGADRDTDLAVIKVKPDNLTSASFGDSDQLEVGDFVIAIGNPFQIGQTATSGIVSGLHRNNVGIEKIEDFIQTDAAIYPGNSGGALINLRGELIGINTAFIGSSKTNPGMGFAIPINMARTIVTKILEHGEAHRTRLGIMLENNNAETVGDMRH